MVDLFEDLGDAADEVGAVLDPDRAASEETEEALDTAVEYSPLNAPNSLLGFESPLEDLAGSQEARAQTHETTEQTVENTASGVTFLVQNQRLVIGLLLIVGALYFANPLIEFANTLAEGGGA